MCDRNTDHGNVMLQLEILAQNRNVFYEETGVYVKRDKKRFKSKVYGHR